MQFLKQIHGSHSPIWQFMDFLHSSFAPYSQLGGYFLFHFLKRGILGSRCKSSDIRGIQISVFSTFKWSDRNSTKFNEKPTVYFSMRGTKYLRFVLWIFFEESSKWRIFWWMAFYHIKEPKKLGSILSRSMYLACKDVHSVLHRLLIPGPISMTGWLAISKKNSFSFRSSVTLFLYNRDITRRNGSKTSKNNFEKASM